MDENLQYTERIDNYLNGLMSEEESDIFKQEISNNALLSKNVEFRHDLILGVQKFGDSTLEKTLGEVESRLDKEGFFLNEEHIRQYLLKELDTSLIKTFEKRLAKDEAFSKEVEFQKSLLLGIERYSKEVEDTTINEIEKKLTKEGFFESGKDLGKEQTPVIDIQKKRSGSKIISLFSRSSIAIAASVLIILTLSVYYFTRPDIYDEVFAANFQPETSKLVVVLDDLESSGLGIIDKKRREQLLAILLLYEAGNYQDAVFNLGNHLSIYPNDNDARFYYGVVLLQIGDIQKAKGHFQELLKNNTNWEKDATWYLALSYLRIKKDRQDAIRLFQIIANDKDSPYQEKANVLIRGLKK